MVLEQLIDKVVILFEGNQPKQGNGPSGNDSMLPGTRILVNINPGQPPEEATDASSVFTCQRAGESRALIRGR